MRLINALLARYHARCAKVLLIRGRKHFERAEWYVKNFSQSPAKTVDYGRIRRFAAYSSCGTNAEQRDSST